MQGGFLAYNCRSFWHEIMVQRWYDNAAGWWWPKITCGDEGGWRLILGYLKPSARQCPIRWDAPAWINSFDGKQVAVHRCSGKLWPDCVPPWNLALPKEKRVIELYRELNADGYRRAAFGKCSRGRPKPSRNWKLSSKRFERQKLLAR